MPMHLNWNSKAGRSLSKLFCFSKQTLTKKDLSSSSRKITTLSIYCATQLAILLAFLPEEHDMNIQEMQIAKPLFKSNGLSEPGGPVGP